MEAGEHAAHPQRMLDYHSLHQLRVVEWRPQSTWKVAVRGLKNAERKTIAGEEQREAVS